MTSRETKKRVDSHNARKWQEVGFRSRMEVVIPKQVKGPKGKAGVAAGLSNCLSIFRTET